MIPQTPLAHQLEMAQSLHKNAVKILADVTLQIAWTKYALKAPSQFTNDVIQARRKAVLVDLLKSLAMFTSSEFIFRVEVERLETKATLLAMGTPFRSAKGVFYLLP